MDITSVKEMWDNIENIYQGDDGLKEAKLQVHRGQLKKSIDE